LICPRATKPRTIPATQERPKKKGMIPTTEHTKEAMARPLVLLSVTKGAPGGPKP
jgi:hypothetical protein